METSVVQNMSYFKKLPDNWEIKLYDEVLKNFSAGNKKILKSQFLEDGKYVIVDQGKLKIAGYTDDNEKLVNTEPPYIVFGDHTRIFKYIDFKFAMGADGTKVLKSIEPDVLTKYIYYYFLTLNIPDTGYNRHYKYLKELKIPLPPLEQQKHIAAVLDAADELRQKDKALIEKYNELAQSLFLEMFGDPVVNPKGWEKKVLGELCGVGSSKRVFVDELVDEGIPFYRGTEIGKLSEGENIKPSLFITKEHYEELKNHTGIPQIGDLLLPSICPDGRIWEVTHNEPLYFKDGRVLWIKVNNNTIVSSYLKSLLKALFYVNYSSIASGTTFAELKIVSLKKLSILLPPIQLQNEFAKRIEVIEKQKEQAELSLQKSDELFHSLLQKAFRGELG